MHKSLENMGKLKKTRNDQVITGYVEGKTIAELADETGVSRQRIHQILKRSSVVMRSRGKPLKERLTVPCRKCGGDFLTASDKRVFCSRKCAYASFRKYTTAAERKSVLAKRREDARIRARKYYHEVFKSRSDWRSIVRSRNKKQRITA